MPSRVDFRTTLPSAGLRFLYDLTREPARGAFWFIWIIIATFVPIQFYPPRTNTSCFLALCVAHVFVPATIIWGSDWILIKHKRKQDDDKRKQEDKEPRDLGWLIWLLESMYAIGYGRHVVAIRWTEFKDAWLEAVIDEAATKLLLAAAIGIIVLFVTRYYSHYRRLTRGMKLAGKNAINASHQLRTNSEQFSQQIKPQVERLERMSKEIFGSISADNAQKKLVEKANKLLGTGDEEIRRLIDDGNTAFGEQNERLHNHLQSLNNKQDFALFMSLYTSYWKTEQFKLAAEPGGMCAFATRFDHYAMAVRSVTRCCDAFARAVEKDDATNKYKEIHPDRFAYFALSRKTPIDWLIRRDGNPVDPNWIVFLERFSMCLRLFEARWYRVFWKDREEAQVAMIDRDLGDWKVLCSKETMDYKGTHGRMGPDFPEYDKSEELWLPVILWRSEFIEEHQRTYPDLWQLDDSPEQLMEQFKKRTINNYNSACSFIQSSKLEIKLDERKPQFILVKSRREFGGTHGDEDVAKMKQWLAANPKFRLISIGDVISTYHPVSRQWEDRQISEADERKLFGDAGVPVDLFAVYDRAKQDWILCLGPTTPVDGLTMNLVYATPDQSSEKFQHFRETLDTIFGKKILEDKGA